MEQSKTKYVDAVEFVENRIDTLSGAKSYQHAADIINLKRERNAFQIFDVLCMVQIGANSITEMYVRKMIAEMRKCPEYMKRGNKHKLDLMEQDLDRYIKALCKALDRRSSNKGYDQLESQTHIADMADVSDEAIQPLVTEIQQYISKHTPLGGECCPREPELFNYSMMAFLSSIVSSLISEFASHRMPEYFHTTQMQFINLSILQRRVNTIISLMYGSEKNNMARNKFGTPLRINLAGILNSKEMMGEKINNVWRSGLLPRLRDLYFSSKYIDLLYIARDGHDPKLREMCDSMIEALGQSKDINIPA